MHWSVEVVLCTEAFGILRAMFLTSKVNAQIMVLSAVTLCSRIRRYTVSGKMLPLSSGINSEDKGTVFPLNFGTYFSPEVASSMFV
jgi:hypothetical protein